MGKVIADQSVSLDGFSAGPNVGMGNGMGDGGDELHTWVFAEGGLTGRDGAAIEGPQELLARAGSVVVEDLMRVLALPTVFHLVSTVRGTLRADVTSGDIGMLIVRLTRPLPGPFPAEMNNSLSHRHLSLLIDGLRPAAREPMLPGPALTIEDLRDFPPAPNGPAAP